MKKLLLLLVVFSIGQTYAQKNNLWTLVSDEKSITSERITNQPYSDNQKFFQLDKQALKQILANAKDLNSGKPGVEITVPNALGEFEKYLVWESSNFEPALQANFPEIRAYVGKGITDKSAKIMFSFDPRGIQTMSMKPDNGTEFIEPYTKDNNYYIAFDSKTRKGGIRSFRCSTPEYELSHDLLNSPSLTDRSSAQTFKTFRLALSCTGEYGAYFGGTTAGALAAMNATMTRVNSVMGVDLAVKLIMINNTTIIYLNASTDPYAAASGMSQWNAQLQSTLTSVVGEANYDIGHLFGASGGGGNAGCIGCVCVNGQKGSGITSPGSGPAQGDSFDIDYVAHEMGHQLGGNHTFTYNYEGSGVQVEPGSGSTIMGYAGVTGSPTDIQANSDPYYVYKTLAQIQANLQSKTCAVNYNASSTPPYVNLKPTVSAGTNYTIPISTAFKLVGSGTGETGETLTYCWEQNNSITASVASSLPDPTAIDHPNFRSINPSTSPIRYMPALATVLANSLTTTWETVSSVDRVFNFALTVRDNALNGGQTNSAANVITVTSAAGPFAVTSQNTSGINWAQGSAQTITWDVANTTAAPINTSNVNIKLSTDGGLNFNTVLASNVPNNGSAAITVPNVSSLTCRLLVEPTNNVYYAVNTNVFSVGVNCNIYTATPNAPIADSPGTSAGTATTSVINVPDSFTVNNMKVNLKINHTKIGDLVVKLTGPTGLVRTLWNRNCSTNSGIDITFADNSGAIVCSSPATGTHNASQASTAFAGYNNTSATGNWTLTVTDNAVNNTGTLVSWAVDFGCTLASPQYEISDLAIYPNPNKGNFNIQFSNPSGDVKVNVFDIRGRRIFENNYSSTSNFNENIQLNNAETGIYLVTIVDGTRKIVKKIIVE
jgi:subtilisin-like proprotein convertase family protein